MIKIWNWVKNNPNRAMFLVPILLVAGISISHVVTWYDIANPLSWAIYLSIAIEVAAMTALVAATNKIKGGVWFMFGLVTLIQMIGNIFFSYKEIDSNGDLFKSWVELTGPMWELIGSDPTDIPSMKRWLSFLEGGLLPVISLTSLHFFVKYGDSDTQKKEIIGDTVEEKEEEKGEEIINDNKIDDDRVKKYVDLQKEVWENVKKLREEGKLVTPTEEEIKDEPTALAFTPYIVEEEDDFSDLDNTLLDGLEEEPYLELNEEDSTIFVEEVTKEPESPNEVLQNALKKYKESKGTFDSPIKNKKTNIKRID
jgi:hypothetical protein